MTVGNMWKQDANSGLFNVVFNPHVVVVRSTAPAVSRRAVLPFVGVIDLGSCAS